MPNHSDVRHFRGGISAISQWTGSEHKEMAKVFYGILIGAADSGVAAAAKAILDFIMYSRLQVHTTSTLRAMEQALEDFHRHKEIFIERESRDQFDIPKVHLHGPLHRQDPMGRHYDGFNTEATERLHIDLAKEAYRASNKRDYHAQMTKYLARLESIDKFTEFLNWKHRKTKRRDAEEDAQRDASNKNSDKDSDSDDSEDSATDTSESDGGDANQGEVETALGKRKRSDGNEEEASGGPAPSASEVSATAAGCPQPTQETLSVRYKISKTPQRMDKFVSTELIQQRHQATDFVPELFKYIQAHIVRGIRTHDQVAVMRFDLFRCFSLTLPKLYHMPEEDDKKRKDRIRAKPITEAKGRVQEKAAQFDTVLVRTASASSPPGSVGEALDLKGEVTSTVVYILDMLICLNDLLSGLRAAQIRVIFKLPDALKIKDHFAYIEWFTPFRNPTTDNGPLSNFEVDAIQSSKC